MAKRFQDKLCAEGATFTAQELAVQQMLLLLRGIVVSCLACFAQVKGMEFCTQIPHGRAFFFSQVLIFLKGLLLFFFAFLRLAHAIIC